jgi:hypothetical protein
MSVPTYNFDQSADAQFSASPPMVPPRRIAIARLGNALGLFLSVTLVLCVLFDLWFPAFAMNSAWAVLLPGFTWITWPSLFLGVAETFAYGWYFALLFGGIYNLLLPKRMGAVSARNPERS